VAGATFGIREREYYTGFFLLTPSFASVTGKLEFMGCDYCAVFSWLGYGVAAF